MMAFSRFLSKLFKKKNRFLYATEGTVFIEMAFALPALVLLSLGIIGLCLFIQVTHKIENTLGTTTGVAAQLSIKATTTDINGILNAVTIMMQPFSILDSTVIITDVQAGPGPVVRPQIVWQVSKHYPDGSSGTTLTSKLGTPGARGKPCPTAALANVISSTTFFGVNDEIIVGEIYYRYNPFFSTYLKLNTSYNLYRSTFFVPRGSGLGQVGFSSGCIVQ